MTQWMLTQGTVTSCKLSWLRSHYGDIYLGDFRPSIYLVAFQYEVNGKLYCRTRCLIAPMKVGENVVVQYDPQNPARILAADQLLTWRDRRKWFGVAIAVGLLLLGIHYNLL